MEWQRVHGEGRARERANGPSRNPGERARGNPVFAALAKEDRGGKLL